MILAVILGVAIGLSATKPIPAVLWILFLVLVNSAYEIVFKKNPITKTESPYVMYLQNLQSIGKIYRYPWFAYVIKSVLIFVPLGMLAYVIAKVFST